MNLLVDGHVHFYECFDAAAFFDGALRNFEAGAAELGVDRWLGCLLFSETSRDHFYRDFRDRATPERPAAGWRFEISTEGTAIWAISSGGVRLLLVAGRQLATREGLEVLALCCDGEFADGLPLTESIKAATDGGAVPVVPWGFGKWWFDRGRIVSRLLHDPGAPRFFLGDNGGRARLSPRPRLFASAAERRLPVLPGTDPLPFASQTSKAGRYGFLLAGDIDRERPACGVKKLLFELNEQPRAYGDLEGLMSFWKYQVAMQIKKRRGGS